jgi:hypothetical protein
LGLLIGESGSAAASLRETGASPMATECRIRSISEAWRAAPVVGAFDDGLRDHCVHWCLFLSTPGAVAADTWGMVSLSDRPYTLMNAALELLRSEMLRWAANAFPTRRAFPT